MFCGPKFGLFRTSENGFSIDTLTPTEIATITGQAEPTLMWLGADPSGADELVIGTDDLVDVSSPTKEVVDAALGGKTTEFDASAEAMEAASNTVLDIGTESLTIMQIMRPTVQASAAAIGKRIGSGSAHGYEMLGTAVGRFEFRCATTSGVITRTIVFDHGTANAQVLLMTRQLAVDRQGMWSREGSSVGTRNSESLTNTVKFSLGNGRVIAQQGVYGPAMVWTGTDGDFGDAAAFESARSLVAVALGYE